MSAGRRGSQSVELPLDMLRLSSYWTSKKKHEVQSHLQPQEEAGGAYEAISVEMMRFKAVGLADLIYQEMCMQIIED